MNRKPGESDAFGFFVLGDASALAAEKARKTTAARRAIKQNELFASEILQAIAQATTIEQLIRHEQALQTIDARSAVSDADRNSILIAKKEYEQLSGTVEQMRRSPGDYIRTNLTIKESKSDYRIMPRSRGLQQISANRARLQNRAAFTQPDQKAIWDARIKLAAKTESMLKTLHNSVVESCKDVT